MYVTCCASCILLYNVTTHLVSPLQSPGSSKKPQKGSLVSETVVNISS